MSESNIRYTEAEALDFHSHGRPGKIEIVATKPMATQRDLSLAYSPGVAVPVPLRPVGERGGGRCRRKAQPDRKRGRDREHRESAPVLPPWV